MQAETLQEADLPVELVGLGLQNDWEKFFSDTLSFSDDEIVDMFDATFDELAARVAEGPSDEEAFTAIKSLVGEVQSRGYVEQAIQMAMTLGAMACNHNHMQGLANEVGQLLLGESDHIKDDGHDHDKHETHDVKSCKDCMAGRRCRKK
ncbi:hypothetical protein IPL68_00095 [Candidatus Saccharibacteria bacterium]|nr:MAG: hypothetical protein IPL68_00095 [Candidatus Saccharibacteria bacterium]